MKTLIWAQCVATTWALLFDPEVGPTSGKVDGYHVELAGHLVGDVQDRFYTACLPVKYFEVTMRVQGFNATNDGPWSHPMTLERIHNFDDGSGAVGFPDFGRFIRSFGTTNPDHDADDNGLVNFIDFGRFIGAFGCRHRPSGVAAGCF
jgi:hypothetical protein